MRSFKLLAAAAVLSSLIAGPVLAQDAMAPAMDSATETAVAPASDTAAPAKHHAKKHAAKKHAAKKKHAKKATNSGVMVK